MSSTEYVKTNEYLLKAIKAVCGNIETFEVLTQPDKGIDSYYAYRSDYDSPGLESFSFDNVSDLKAALCRLWGNNADNMEDIIKIVSLATFKHNPIEDSATHRASSETTDNPLSVSGNVYQF